MRRPATATVLTLSLLLVAACGTQAAPAQPAPAQPAPAQPAPAQPAPAQPAPVPGGELGYAATEAVPGVWRAGDAGTVAFDVVDGALVLGEITPAPGWTVTDVEQEPGEIEVDFRQGPTEVEIEIELSSTGILEIEIDTEIEPAAPGTIAVGDAGTFTFTVDGAALALTDLTVENGWQVTDRSETPGEIEVELRRGAAEWDIEIEIDNGIVEVETDFEITSLL